MKVSSVFQSTNRFCEQEMVLLAETVSLFPGFGKNVRV